MIAEMDYILIYIQLVVMYANYKYICCCTEETVAVVCQYDNE